MLPSIMVGGSTYTIRSKTALSNYWFVPVPSQARVSQSVSQSAIVLVSASWRCAGVCPGLCSLPSVQGEKNVCAQNGSLFNPVPNVLIQ